MPPVNVVRVANQKIQRWIDSKVALKPMVQRQKRAARSWAVERSTMSWLSRSPPNLATARMVPACMQNSIVDP